VEQQISKEPATLSTTAGTEGIKISEEKPQRGSVIALETRGTGGETTVWQARPIAAGSLTGKTYTVQSGDTLWEIANGRYGSGFEWYRLLNANKDKIGFLPNGTQALITPGQVLVLPD
jgi:nucleoid-associated protein YgaU